MEEFWEKCKKRPTVLWILAAVWVIVGLMMSGAALYRYRSLIGLMFLSFAVGPICHLWLFVKPLTFFEVLHIIVCHLVLTNSLSMLLFPVLWNQISHVIYFSLAGFYCLLMVVFMILDTIMHKKYYVPKLRQQARKQRQEFEE